MAEQDAPSALRRSARRPTGIRAGQSAYGGVASSAFRPRGAAPRGRYVRIRRTAIYTGYVTTAHRATGRVAELTDLLGKHGVPSHLVGSVIDALEDYTSPVTKATVTDGEYAFALAAGVSPTVFTAEAERENAMYEAASEAALEAQLHESLFTTNEAADLLGVDPANVRRMLGRGDVMTAGQIDGQSAYPKWQFHGSKAIRGLRKVLPAFPADFHPLDIEQVMTSRAEALGGRSPREWLISGGPASAVVSYVSALARA